MIDTPSSSQDTGPNGLERRILDSYQRDFPLTSRPYAAIAERFGVREDDVLTALERLEDSGVVARIGAVVAPHSVGWSTLAAMCVPADRLNEVAALISDYREVNHNYEREHRFNLWFVVTAPDARRVAEVLDEIGRRTGLDVLDLPLVEAYHIDLGFPLKWS